MNPIKAQRTWHSLSAKWINASPFGRGIPYKKNSRRKIKKGIISNLIPVEVVNAITGEIHKGYMRDLSIRRLRKWLEYHNHRAEAEQILIPLKSTFYNLKAKDFENFPILIKLGKYQVPYLIDHVRLDKIVDKKWTAVFSLKTADNLKYLEIIAERKPKIIKLFNKIKKKTKKK